MQANINSVNKTWVVLQTTGGEDDPNIFLMLKSKYYIIFFRIYLYISNLYHGPYFKTEHMFLYLLCVRHKLSCVYYRPGCWSMYRNVGFYIRSYPYWILKCASIPASKNNSRRQSRRFVGRRWWYVSIFACLKEDTNV
jgi:hypothetical protein